MKSITVEKLLGNNKNYQQVTGNEESLKRVILTGEINRPGFELAGFFKHSDFRRIIVFGDKEMAFIAEMTEERRLFRVFDFRVRKRGLTARTPVNYSLSLINQTFFVQINEIFFYRSRTFFVHSERQTRPVARRAERFELLDDPSAILIFPCPCPF